MESRGRSSETKGPRGDKTSKGEGQSGIRRTEAGAYSSTFRRERGKSEPGTL